MASLIPSGNASGTGSMTLTAPATNSNQTITLPDATGTAMVSGNMPAFSAYSNNTQSISNSVWTKVVLNTEEFDTANAFDSTTNYRFTPQVAGYYQINAQVSFGASTTFPNNISTGIYKNGSLYKKTQISVTLGQINSQLLGSTVVYLNGSTDYVELYALAVGASGPQLDGGQTITSMSGYLARAA